MKRVPYVPKTLDDLTLDDRNANRDTPRGRAVLADSLTRFGAGRSIVTDRTGRVLGGNKTVEAARALGLRMTVVPSDGRSLVVVQRTDLDLATDPYARAYAIADNRVAAIDLDWDPAVLQQLQAEGLPIEGCWTADEWATLMTDQPIAIHARAWTCRLSGDCSFAHHSRSILAESGNANPTICSTC